MKFLFLLNKNLRFVSLLFSPLTISLKAKLILERYCFVLGWITLSDIDVKEAGAFPWSPELGRDKLLEIEYFISFSRILCHNVHIGHTGELSQLANIILDILSQLQTLYKEHSVKERGWLSREYHFAGLYDYICVSL